MILVRRRTVLPPLVWCVFAAVGAAQDSKPASRPAPFRMPRESPAAVVRQEVGLAALEIRYSRPAWKGRDFAADLAELKGPWRFGANAATQFILDRPAEVAGKPLAAGTYALFAFPGEKEWTIVFNAVPAQWGSYFHDPAKDVLRIVAPVAKRAHRERLTFALDLSAPDVVDVDFSFGPLGLAFPVKFDLKRFEDEQIATALAALAPADWATRLQISQLLITRRERLDQAERLLAEAAAVSSSFWLDEWRGRLGAARGDLVGSAELLETAARKARGTAPAEYCDQLVKLAAAWRAGREKP
jgi:hypothetical protein